ncbi:hypothetical protein XL92_001453 [Salmonella enterica subsp. enterica]|nr:hypothetical protein [Salmonella enterica subsp. enterica]
MNALNIIKKYLSDNISSETFQQELYNNKEMGILLSEEMYIPPYINSNENVFLYLIESDLSSPAGELNCKDLLAKYLTKKGVDFVFDGRHRELHSMLIKIQPSWVRIPNEYLKHLMNKHPGKSGKELENALKKDIASNFQCIDKKPKWLQSPCWPIENNTPLIFIGQFNISKIRHDESFIYVFYNKKENNYITLEQSM